MEGGCVRIGSSDGRPLSDRPGLVAFLRGLRQAFRVAPGSLSFVETDEDEAESLLNIEQRPTEGAIVMRLSLRLHLLGEDPDPRILLDDRSGNFMHDGTLRGWEAILAIMDKPDPPVQYDAISLNGGKLLACWAFAALNAVKTDALVR